MSFHFSRAAVASVSAAFLSLAIGASQRRVAAGTGYSPAEYAAGMSVWRKPGATADHAACANCHGPDGLDLAAYAFDDADIRRRALVHLDSDDSQRVVQFIHCVRSRYAIHDLSNPMTDRPLQPGGHVLPGATADERDVAFGRELAARVPSLFQGRINDVRQAKKAAARLLEIDPWSLPIGVPLNRLSEDVAHGTEHASIAQWLPEVMPSVPDRDRARWFSAVDEYLAGPSVASLRKLISLHEQLTTRPNLGGIESLSNFKYRALLVLDYRLRTRRMGGPQPSSGPEIVPPGQPNPAWEVGDLARVLEMQNQRTLGFGSDLEAKKLGGPALRDQLSDLSLAWLWLGWMFDQGMYHSRAGRVGIRGDWLARALWLHGPYPIHNIYSTTRRQLVASFDRTAWLGDPSAQHLAWDYAAVRIGHRFISQIPTDPVQRRLYLSFAANCFRMNLLLLLDELQRTHIVWMRLNCAQNVRELTDFVVMADPASKIETEQLRGKLLGLIQTAEERF